MQRLLRTMLFREYYANIYMRLGKVRPDFQRIFERP